ETLPPRRRNVRTRKPRSKDLWPSAQEPERRKSSMSARPTSEPSIASVTGFCRRPRSFKDFSSWKGLPKASAWFIARWPSYRENFRPSLGKTLTAKFEDTDAGQKATLTVALRVRKQDALYIGPCQYKVLRIDRSAGYGNNSPQFLETDYYAPDLTFIIAKEYKEDNGSTTLNKYDKIYPMNP